MAYSVFISYSTRDLRTAEVIRGWVQHAGATVFLAQYSVPPGQQLAEQVLAAIRNCDLFLLMWSQGARGSDWVPQEIGVARGLNKPILPIVLDANAPPPGFIQGLKYLPLYPNAQAAVEWLHQSVTAQVKQKEVQGWVVVGILAAVVAALLVSARE